MSPAPAFSQGREHDLADPGGLCDPEHRQQALDDGGHDQEDGGQGDRVGPGATGHEVDDPPQQGRDRQPGRGARRQRGHGDRDPAPVRAQQAGERGADAGRRGDRQQVAGAHAVTTSR